jgi:hypothetical protein
LEFCDVITTHHGNPVIQQPFTQAVAGIDKGTPRIRANDAIDRKTAAALEVCDRSAGRVPEYTARVVICRVSKRTESRLDVPNTLSAVALMK